MFSALNSVAAQIEPDFQLIRWEWAGPIVREDFRAAFEKLVACSTAHGVTRWLADISRMPPVGIDEQAWLSEMWMEQFAAAGIRAVAVIEPIALHNQLVVESILADGRRYTRTEIQFFSDIPAALDWLAGSDQQAQQLEARWEQHKAQGE
ncbi:STAS/SEC14 domain-containing protein [Hymenobacter sp. DG01]|uniref:STAS/SEC14 domain-containing protein n=1 Tax=Hymenobacter sp. DG01 TaxID=2584940 RepID=UPI0011233E62|nr:STAS/SEC14 domain-containing protein [Hymenobacter sp. DG01]